MASWPIMEFGETLILSDLTQRESFYNETGVPLLKDVPGVQYFFNREEDVLEETTILILVTPKREAYAFRAIDDESSDGSTSESGVDPSGNLGEFKSRYDEEFSPPPAMERVFENLQTSNLYREFRTGDIILGRWDSAKDIQFTIDQVLGYLYY